MFPVFVTPSEWVTMFVRPVTANTPFSMVLFPLGRVTLLRLAAPEKADSPILRFNSPATDVDRMSWKLAEIKCAVTT